MSELISEAGQSFAWVGLTLMAVVLQSARTAGQKHLTSDLSAFGATFVRFFFGLPFAIGMLWAVIWHFDVSVPTLHLEFWGLAAIASVAQIAATVLLVHLFSLRNFAVGSTYARTEAFLTACLGVLLFGEVLSAMGWLAVLVSVAGVVTLTVARNHVDGGSLIQNLATPAAAVGLASGLCFAIGSLVLRRASLSLGSDNWLLSACVTLVCMVSMQTVMMSLWIGIRERAQFEAIRRRWRLCLFVGMTSAFGSFGWFAAMTLERAAYVKALGQIEFLLALVISTLFFREKTNRLELLGMACIAAGVLVLLFFG